MWSLTDAGSVAGSVVMHAIGRKGGEAFVRRRFAGDRIERTMASLRRHGVMAVLIPSLLPPPAPFKIFVLLAGVVGISATRCAIAIAIGRFGRFLCSACLPSNTATPRSATCGSTARRRRSSSSASWRRCSRRGCCGAKPGRSRADNRLS